MRSVRADPAGACIASPFAASRPPRRRLPRFPQTADPPGASVWSRRERRPTTRSRLAADAPLGAHVHRTSRPVPARRPPRRTRQRRVGTRSRGAANRHRRRPGERADSPPVAGGDASGPVVAPPATRSRSRAHRPSPGSGHTTLVALGVSRPPASLRREAPAEPARRRWRRLPRVRALRSREMAGRPTPSPLVRRPQVAVTAGGSG